MFSCRTDGTCAERCKEYPINPWGLDAEPVCGKCLGHRRHGFCSTNCAAGECRMQRFSIFWNDMNDWCSFLKFCRHYPVCLVRPQGPLVLSVLWAGCAVWGFCGVQQSCRSVVLALLPKLLGPRALGDSSLSWEWLQAWSCYTGTLGSHHPEGTVLRETVKVYSKRLHSCAPYVTATQMTKQMACCMYTMEVLSLVCLLCNTGKPTSCCGWGQYKVQCQCWHAPCRVAQPIDDRRAVWTVSWALCQWDEWRRL